MNRVILVSALGYLVDIYDLILFGIVRIASLRDLGFAGDDLFSKGVLLANTQLIGLLAGGILWGILGDRIGRVAALFGSILLFSFANFANGFVHALEPYLLCRFLAGVGLAGELGIGVTLASEILPAEQRSYGATAITGIGLTGGLLASVVSWLCGWRSAFVIGGVLGLLVLLFRKRIADSEVFLETKKARKTRSSKRPSLFSWNSIRKYIQCVALGAPTQFILGILIVFAPELMAAKGLKDPVQMNQAVLLTYLGGAIGAVFSGAASHRMKSRKTVVARFLVFATAAILLFILAPYQSLPVFYILCFAVGLACGFWTVALLISAEQFGTDVRATAVATIPNFTRAVLILLTIAFAHMKTSVGVCPAALLLGLLVMAGAGFATWSLEETFGKNLNFLETSFDDSRT